jgi:hypothetical protein
LVRAREVVGWCKEEEVEEQGGGEEEVQEAACCHGRLVEAVDVRG